MRLLSYTQRSFTTTRLLAAINSMWLPDRPHIIYHLVDDWGWSSWPHRGAVAASQGLPRAMLPSIAELTNSGLTLDQHYAARSCAPSRRALLSGRFLNSVGSHNDDCPGLSLSVTTLPELLQRAGYRTILLGKWHAGFFHDALSPTRRGFSAALGSYSGSVVHSSHCRHDRDRCWMHPRLASPPTNQTIFDLFDVVDDGGGGGADDGGGDDGGGSIGYSFWHGRQPQHATELYTERFESLVAQHDPAVPLFALLSWSAPHHPFQPQCKLARTQTRGR